MTAAPLQRGLVVWSQSTDVRFWSRVEKDPLGCWTWRGERYQRGYGQFWSNGKLRRAHRVAYELLVGPIPEGLWVLHHCDNPPCIRPDHLWLGTRQDNMTDMAMKRRGSGGVPWPRHPAKLDPDRVRAIRSATGETQRELAARYGVSRSTIQLVRSGKRWEHVA